MRLPVLVVAAVVAATSLASCGSDDAENSRGVTSGSTGDGAVAPAEATVPPVLAAGRFSYTQSGRGTFPGPDGSPREITLPATAALDVASAGRELRLTWSWSRDESERATLVPGPDGLVLAGREVTIAGMNLSCSFDTPPLWLPTPPVAEVRSWTAKATCANDDIAVAETHATTVTPTDAGGFTLESEVVETALGRSTTTRSAIEVSADGVITRLHRTKSTDNASEDRVLEKV